MVEHKSAREGVICGAHWKSISGKRKHPMIVQEYWAYVTCKSCLKKRPPNTKKTNGKGSTGKKMSKRFGRNQKRKAREEIQRLGSDLDVARSGLRRAHEELRRHDRETPRQEAFQDFVRRQGLIRHAVEIVAQEIGKQVGRELAPAAIKLYREILLQPDAELTIDLDPMSFTGKAIEVLRGQLRANYNVTLDRL